MILVKFEKTIQVGEDEWRNVFVEKVFDKTETLETIVNWAKVNQDKPKDPKVTQRPNTSSSWQTFNKTEKENETKKKKRD